MLECECKHSHRSTTIEYTWAVREQSGDAGAKEASACREGAEVYWIVSMSGLVAGFVYEFHFQWFIVDGQVTSPDLRKNFSTSTSSYTVRIPLDPKPHSQIRQKNRGLNIDTSMWDAYFSGPFEIEVTVRDMHPGLANEDALIGTRSLNTAVNTVRVQCTAYTRYTFSSAEAPVYLLPNAGSLLCPKNGWMEFRFAVPGVSPGMQYKVRLEAMAEGDDNGRFSVSNVLQFTDLRIQRWEMNWSASGAQLHSIRVPLSPGEVATIVWRDAVYRATSPPMFRISLFDMQGLVVEEDRASVPITDWTKEDLDEANTRLSVVRSDQSSWIQDESLWRVWLEKSFKHIATSSFIMNMPHIAHHLSTEQKNEEMEFCDEKILRIPVAVINLPNDYARREQSTQQLLGIGFTNVSFPSAIPWSEVDEEKMVSEGMLAYSLFYRFRNINDTASTPEKKYEKKYAAHALTTILRIRAAAAANEPVIIMDDDLMATAPLHTTRDRICHALSNVPPTADMVYLEGCYETCSKLSYDGHYPR
jgi:hypothetical protein